MNDFTLTESIKTFGLRQVISHIDNNPEKNVPKILDRLIRTDKNGVVSHQARVMKGAFQDEDNNWRQLILSLWTDIDDGVRRMLLENFVVNASLIGSPRQIRLSQKENCNIPRAILMDPTSACNLHCRGCWAADYGNGMNLSLEQMDDIVRQGKEMGTYFYIFSGGEPLTRKEDVLLLCAAHPDCSFLSFTNGTLIDEEFAGQMLSVKNLVPAISIEGFEDATDARRGAGTFRAAVNAMGILRRKKLPFGISCCYTRENAEMIGSEAYFDEMIRLGAKFMWLFTYMPVGKNAAPDLMATPEQRAYIYRKVREYRKTKPIFTMDFRNDGEFVGGCVAGGRAYIHINANGDIEPCAFIHYSDSNIKTKTLLEAYQSPLFMQYRNGQPFNENHLRPCPLLDNPEKLGYMVDVADAVSTDLQNPEDVHDLTAKCEHAAECWAPIANELWKQGHACHQMKR